MKHIRYMTSNKTICEKPDNLGSDFVIQDFAPTDASSCGICFSLLTAHNKREYEREGLVNILQDHNVAMEDPLAPARGLVNGIIISSMFWICVLVLLWFFGVIG